MAAGCLLAMALPAPAATPDDEEIKALKDAISKLSQRLDALEKARAQDARTLEQNQKVHEQDQQEVQRLKQQLQETQKTATDAQQKAEAASQVQPVHPIPEGRPAAQNFMVAGDAEVQFGKTDGEHGGLAVAGAGGGRAEYPGWESRPPSGRDGASCASAGR